ncbi:unnamed protein product [Closterium sp. NIES-64]|nr:unnamed protein product [Closterium sp. NIES-64]
MTWRSSRTEQLGGSSQRPAATEAARLAEILVAIAAAATFVEEATAARTPMTAFILYVRAVVLGHKRGKSNVHEHTSLLQIENVQSKEESQWYLGKRIVYIYKAKTLKNGSLYRSMWGRVTRPHGNTGVVRAKFKKNLPCTATGRRVRKIMAFAVISARSCKPIASSQSLCRAIGVAGGAISTRSADHGASHDADRGASISTDAAGNREFHGAAASGRQFRGGRRGKQRARGTYGRVGSGKKHRGAAGAGRQCSLKSFLAIVFDNESIVVMGGNGFVGSAICRNAIGQGIEVASVNRRRPEPFFVEAALARATGVVSEWPEV